MHMRMQQASPNADICTAHASTQRSAMTLMHNTDNKGSGSQVGCNTVV
jgi:hypothetical protein